MGPPMKDATVIIGLYFPSRKREARRAFFYAIMRSSANSRYAYSYDRLVPVKFFLDKATKDATNEIFRV